MLEKQIEAKGVKYANSRGVSPYKFSSPNRMGVPDRMLLANVALEHREIVARYVRFIEFKRSEGGKLSPSQDREISHLRQMGYVVDVVNDPAATVAIVDQMNTVP